MDVNELRPKSDEAKFLHLPYNERWEHLRPVITELYLGKYGPNGRSMTISQVSVFMRDNYSFFAAETQYRRWFREWNVRKRILTSEKNDIVAVISKRPLDQASTSNVTLENNKSVDKKQMRRYLGDRLRHRHAEPVSPGVLSLWNLPYAALSKAFAVGSAHPSPFGIGVATPSYLNVNSPEVTTPGNGTGPSPTTQLISQKAAHDRASFLLQGRFNELLSSCTQEDRRTLTGYLHDFYIQSFVAAKYWGKGPKTWTPGMVHLFTFGQFDASNSGRISAPSSPRSQTGPDTTIDAPTHLCRWSIHVPKVQYEALPEAGVKEQDDGCDVRDSRSWSNWNEAPPQSFPQLMQDSLTTGAFSNAGVDGLPISTQTISNSIQQDPSVMVAEAWKMAIIAGNFPLIDELFEQLESNQGLLFSYEEATSRIRQIHPFHIAATYLDGGNVCCKTFEFLHGTFGQTFFLGDNTDSAGHTIVDVLLITILRSHTSVSPGHISQSFNPPGRFPGEEKDICGRWDSDSPAVRALFQQGYARIPTSWKHAFCHTATQAICHSLIVLFGSPMQSKFHINHLSGLFTRRCENCGLELKLGPLHTLVVVAFYLASRGRPGETLFGALAVLVCLLSLGANPDLEVQVMADGIFNTSTQPSAETETCRHEPMVASNLMQVVPGELISGWSAECQAGWSCMQHVLLLAGDRDQGQESDKEEDDDCDGDEEEDDDCDGDEEEEDDDSDGDDDESIHQSHCSFEKHFRGKYGLRFHGSPVRCPRAQHAKLGLLWATIQVEFLTYRRICAGDSWISPNFSMNALQSWLSGEAAEFHTPLLDMMVEPTACCGWFVPSFIPTAQDVCTRHFMNMDVYERATFISSLDWPFWVELWHSM